MIGDTCYLFGLLEGNTIGSVQYRKYQAYNHQKLCCLQAAGSRARILIQISLTEAIERRFSCAEGARKGMVHCDSAKDSTRLHRTQDGYPLAARAQYAVQRSAATGGKVLRERRPVGLPARDKREDCALQAGNTGHRGARGAVGQHILQPGELLAGQRRRGRRAD